MIRPILPRLAPTKELLRAQCRNPKLYGEIRVTLWCWGHVNQYGHAPANPGQLLTELGFSRTSEVSRVIDKARRHGLLDECSTAACLVLPGHSVAPCEANHRSAA